MNSQLTFIEDIRARAELFRSNNPSRAIIVHHNDTDGLTSGAILAAAIGRAGIPVQRYCLEKPYPVVMERIIEDAVSEKGTALFVTDFASGMLPKLSELAGGRIDLYVLDHHQISSVSDERLYLLNGLEYGLRNTDFSASAVCYQFALGLNEWNRDLAWLGTLGALGDGFLEDGRLAGINAGIWESVESDSLGFFDGSYHFKVGMECDAAMLKAYLDTCGSIAYSRGGPDVAVKALTDGLDEGFVTIAARYLNERDQCFAKFLKGSSLTVTDHIQWFDLSDSFSSMGVKTVGLLCEYLIASDAVDPDRYVAGFQHIPHSIPGLGDFQIEDTKISMRVPESLRKKIENCNAPSLLEILPPATKRLSGFVDACHPTAAATTIPIGKEEALIAEMEKILSK